MSISIIKLSVLLLLPVIYKACFFAACADFETDFAAALFHICSIGYYYLMEAVLIAAFYFMSGDLLIAKGSLNVYYWVFIGVAIVLGGIHCIAFADKGLTVNPIHLSIFTVLMIAGLGISCFFMNSTSKETETPVLMEQNPVMIMMTETEKE